MTPRRAPVVRPLEGIKVVDFSVSIAGPVLAAYLGSFGAEVVKVETNLKPDILRLSSPCKDGVSGVDRSALFSYMNPSKYSMALDMNHERKGEIVRKLLAWTDVVIENFTVGVKEGWGLDYASVSRINPRAIMMSTTSQGQTGPHRQHPAWGWSMKSLCGFTHLSGWPDREGSAPAPSYTDEVSPWFAITAMLAALDYRRRTGKGQFIDHSQVEASLHFLSPAILDYTANGRRQMRAGNSSSFAAPHGCYRCLGEDRWCVIAVFTDSEWEAFCRVLGDPPWTKAPGFATLEGRKANEVELDRLVESWTVNQRAEEVMARLQSVGIAAGVVQDEEDILDRDPHLRSRGYFARLNHSVTGEHWVMGFPFKLSRSRPQSRPAPCLGEHTELVCCKLLGMSTEEFVDLVQSGVFT